MIKQLFRALTDNFLMIGFCLTPFLLLVASKTGLLAGLSAEQLNGVCLTMLTITIASIVTAAVVSACEIARRILTGLYSFIRRLPELIKEIRHEFNG